MMVKRLPSPWNFFSVNLIWSNRRHNSSLEAKKKLKILTFRSELSFAAVCVMQFLVSLELLEPEVL